MNLIIKLFKLLLTVLCFDVYQGQVTHRELLDGLRLQRQGDFLGAKQRYQHVISHHDERKDAVDAWQLLGVLEFMGKAYDQAVRCLENAYAMDGSNRAEIAMNLGEAYRLNGQVDQAINVLIKALQSDKSKLEESLYYNLGVAYTTAGNLEAAIETYDELLRVNPRHYNGLENLLLLLINTSGLRVESTFLKADPIASWDLPCTLCVWYGVWLHQQSRLSEAEKSYLKAIECLPVDDSELLPLVFGNMGGILQARGDFTRAIEYYQLADLESPGNINNLGACLWSLGHQLEAIETFERALEIDPSTWEALINLGNAFYEQGDVVRARSCFNKVLELQPKTQTASMRVRLATLSHPIMPACDNETHCGHVLRDPIEQGLNLLLLDLDESWRIENPITQVERLPFYWVYQGYNEYQNQAKLASFYQHVLPVDPNDHVPCTALAKTSKIGFISKFWQENHAHGQLLSGIINGVREDQREVLVFVLPNVAGPTSDQVVKAAHGNVVFLNGSLRELKHAIRAFRLDVLIYADTMSEPVTHFLAKARLARTQVAFWGNPLTTGSPQMDYFISGEWMEPEHAAREHYHEQLVKLPGLGIYYDNISIPEGMVCPETPRYEVRYGVLQSSFKLHPKFDLVLEAILHQVPNAYIYLLEARQKGWTEALRQRLQKRPSLPMDRVVFLPRVASSEEYLKMLNDVDIVLHPFPFGGSKTSADAIALGLPIVVMKGDFLRGRMAYSMMKTMDIPERYIAHDMDQYVKLAVQLGVDEKTRYEFRDLITERGHLIFRNHRVLEEWNRFLDRVIRSDRMECQHEIELSIQQANAHGDLEHAQTLLLHLLGSGIAEKEKTSSLYNDLGSVTYQLWKHQQAIEYLINAVEIQWIYPVAHNNLGVVYQSIKQFEKAKMHYNIARKQDPTWMSPVYNIGNLLRDQGKLEEAYSLYMKTMGLQSEPLSIQLESILSAQLLLNGNDHLSHIANNAAKLVDWADYQYLVEKRVPKNRDSQQEEGFRNQKVVLVVQYFQPPNEARNREIELALTKNIENKDIDEIILLVEDDHVLPKSQQDHENLRMVNIGERLTFRLAIEYANRYLKQGTICIIANADIYFDETIRLTKRSDKSLNNTILALLRWEIDYRTGTPYLAPRIDSQDSWIFQVPLPMDQTYLDATDFHLGRLRCDNRIAHIFMEAGLRVLNTPFDIQSFHLHRNTSRDPNVEIQGEGSFVLLSFW